ncbi:NAD-dependent epimerase/dehydratase family protein [bacterium]|nr:NAD-dependent epimerase/dehydratase family protein [bacterium]
MRILVTGGTGFVGSHIVDRLCEEGHRVVVAIRESSNLRWLNKDAERIIAPMERLDALKTVLPKMDAVVHCAGAVRAKRKSDFFKTNLLATVKLAELCSQYASGLKRFVFISSQAAGKPGRDCEVINETTMECPVSSYGCSKLEAERALRSFSSLFPVTIIRPPMVYGPRDKDVYTFFKMISKGIILFPGDPERQFSAIYVKDLAEAVSVSLDFKNDFSVYFIEDGQTYTWRKFTSAIARELGKRTLSIRLPKFSLITVSGLARGLSLINRKPPLLSLEKAYELSKNWVCDGSLFRYQANWEPHYNVKHGIAETIEWYKKNGWL